jgi:SAM-dependent methyltransferase
MTLASRLRRAVTLVAWDHPQRILVDRFVARVSQGVPKAARILDAGAGECRYAGAFAHCRYIACDRGVGDATWNYSHLNVVADLMSLPFRKDSFDGVLCANVLEHVKEPPAALRDMTSLLKPGGRLYLSVPFLGDPIHQEPNDFRRYTHYGLRQLIEGASLTPISISPMGGVFFLICSLLWWCAVVDRRPNASTLRTAASAFLLLVARFATMLTMSLRQTDSASRYFTCGYTAVAEKRCSHSSASGLASVDAQAGHGPRL